MTQLFEIVFIKDIFHELGICLIFFSFFDFKLFLNDNLIIFCPSSDGFFPQFLSSPTGLDGGAAPCEGEEQEEQPEHLQSHHGRPVRSAPVCSGPVCSDPDRFGSAGLRSPEPPWRSVRVSHPATEGDSGPSAAALDFIHPPATTQLTNQKPGRQKAKKLGDKNFSVLLVYSKLYPEYLPSATNVRHLTLLKC